jgi:hypothetical protein
VPSLALVQEMGCRRLRKLVIDCEFLLKDNGAFLAREETADEPSIRGLYDFSEVAAIAVPQTKAAERGSRSAIVRGQRVMVQSRTLACSLVETFVQSQRLAGDNLLAVVDSLDEAHALLGLNAPHFEVIG